MPLFSGDRLGPYEIVSPIGAGGMGEVYRAYDARLHREVAIKVSAERFTERFQKEARAIASLNHANICTLYDIGPNFLVMELVEGQTLAELIEKGALPLDETLAIAGQIADALEAAHAKGITHRDLKPANIKITPAGTVKVLDFGLAKLADAPSDRSGNSPTLTMDATQAGVILGTAGYMAPEQARGKEVDRRADIWAFGVVLYEMLTARRLFRGNNFSETLASVIKDVPNLDKVPTRGRRLVRTCLEKDPAQRLQAIADWRFLLEDESRPPVKTSAMTPWIVAMTMGIATLAALWQLSRAERPLTRPVVRLDVDLGADVALPATTTSTQSNIAISPDGRRIVYRSGSPFKLFSRMLSQEKVIELTGTERASGPFFSPDGLWIGFFADGKVKKVSVEGGSVVPVGDLTSFAGASWSKDGSIIASQLNKGLLRLPAGGGVPEMVGAVGSGESVLALPQILPGGKAVLFAAVPSDSGAGLSVDQNTIEVLTLADRRRKIVARGGQSPRYLSTSDKAGYLLYVNKTTLFAIPFDLDKLETSGTAVPILQDVAYETRTGAAEFDLSSSGTLIYRKANGESATTTLQYLDGAGTKEPLSAKPGLYQDPAFSPDGTRIALAVTEGESRNIWTYEPQRNAMIRLTSGGAVYDHPIWSPNGQFVIFGSEGNGLFEARADGSGQSQPLTRSKTTQIPENITRDGAWLAYDDDVTGKMQIWTVPLEDSGSQLKAGSPDSFLKNSSDDDAQMFSPDGRWLAYCSNESGRLEVYVRPFRTTTAGHSERWQISNEGGTAARWSPNGHELVYRAGEQHVIDGTPSVPSNQLMTVNYKVIDGKFVTERPRVWIAELGGTYWDLAPDGKRVIVLTPVDASKIARHEHELVFFENFLEYLRAPLSAGR